MTLRALLRLTLTSALLGGLTASAQNDQGSIPYPSQQRGPDERGELPRRSDPSYVPPEEYPYEQEERNERLSGIDDPGIGLYAEFLAAAMFVEASRGSLVDARFGIGARVTWDWGRIFANDVIRQAFFVDLQYLTTGFRDGTQEIFVDTRFHYLTIAPAYTFPFGDGSAYGFFLQVGGGLSILQSSLTADGISTPNGGIQGVFQYGLGIRGKPKLGTDSLLRLNFRIDVTRFRRGYADDTYVGGAIGFGF